MRPLRVAVSVPVRYRVIAEEEWREGVSVNISRTGMLVRVSQLARLGAEVDVALSVPQGLFAGLAGEIICTGLVARHAVDAGGGAGIAIMFRRCRPATASSPSAR